jgi:molecular chaperone HscB
MICWHCHEPTQSAVCVGCGSIQPPPPAPDPFEILGLQRRYFLQISEVDQAWRALSRLVHPDRFAGKPAVMRRMSLQWTAAINSARQDLLSPERRAWLLATGDPNPPETRHAPADQAFLEAIFELQMGAEDDPDGTQAQAAELQDRERARLESIFTEWEAGEGHLEEISLILGRLSYLNTALHLTH